MEKPKEEFKGGSGATGCGDACEACDCFADPEDAFIDLEKMTSQEKKDYLDELFRNRSVGC
jgi:hypothetical protein